MGMSRIGLESCEENRVDSEGMDVIEMLGNAVETAVFGGAEVDWIYLVDDGVLPPDVGAHAGAYPAGSGEGLRQDRRGDAGEAECEKSAGSRHGHRAR